MANHEISELGLKFAAFSSAVTDMLASLSYENAVLRDLLVTHGHLSVGEYDQTVKKFGQAAWETQRSRVHNKVHELTDAALARLKGSGPVQ